MHSSLGALASKWEAKNLFQMGVIVFFHSYIFWPWRFKFHELNVGEHIK
jgi:hypothetical protein